MKTFEQRITEFASHMLTDRLDRNTDDYEFEFDHKTDELNIVDKDDGCVKFYATETEFILEDGNEAAGFGLFEAGNNEPMVIYTQKEYA